ncbi:hypothetical protein D917_09780, partial [Trichinella nativa]
KNNRTREKRVFELSKQKKETQTCTKSNRILLTTVSTNLIDQAKAHSEHVHGYYAIFKQKMGDDSDINRIHSHRDPFTNNLSDLINALDRFFGERPTHSNSTTVRRRPRIPVNAESATSSMARSVHLEQLHTSGMSSGEDAKNNTADNSDSENEISSRYVLPFDRQVGRRRANSHVEPDSIMDTSQKKENNIVKGN